MKVTEPGKERIAIKIIPLLLYKLTLGMANSGQMLPKVGVQVAGPTWGDSK